MFVLKNAKALSSMYMKDADRFREERRGSCVLSLVKSSPETSESNDKSSSLRHSLRRMSLPALSSGRVLPESERAPRNFFGDALLPVAGNRMIWVPEVSEIVCKDEMTIWDKIFLCSPRFQNMLSLVFVLCIVINALCAATCIFWAPFAVTKDTNTWPDARINDTLDNVCLFLHDINCLSFVVFVGLLSLTLHWSTSLLIWQRRKTYILLSTGFSLFYGVASTISWPSAHNILYQIARIIMTLYCFFMDAGSVFQGLRKEKKTLQNMTKSTGYGGKYMMIGFILTYVMMDLMRYMVSRASSNDVIIATLFSNSTDLNDVTISSRKIENATFTTSFVLLTATFKELIFQDNKMYRTKMLQTRFVQLSSLNRLNED